MSIGVRWELAHGRSWLALPLALLCGSCATLGVDGVGAGMDMGDMQLPPQALQAPQEYVVVTVRNDVAAPALGVASTPRGYNSIAPYTAGREARGHARALAQQYGLSTAAAWPIAVLGVHCLVYRMAEGTDRRRLLDDLRRDSRVESAQALETFSTRANAYDNTYNDTYVGLQRNLQELAVPQAQRFSRGQGVRVAVIDSGVDVDHPDLAGRVAGRSDFVGRRDAASVRGDRHGTAVAGVIAAVAHNNLGIVGIAPEVRLLALQACWEQEADDAAVCNTFTLAQALAAAIEARADVVNLSLAGPHDALLARLVRRGQQAGIIFVGAAHGDPAAARGFPLDVEGVIGVVAAESAAADESLIAAPGEDIFTLAPAGAYNAVSGSSMAAAQVSAMVALLRAHDPKLSAARAAALLSGSQRPFETAGGTRQAIHACRAIAALSPGLDCDQPALRQAIRGTNRRH